VGGWFALCVYSPAGLLVIDELHVGIFTINFESGKASLLTRERNEFLLRAYYYYMVKTLKEGSLL
jgi:hypothetical protein